MLLQSAYGFVAFHNTKIANWSLRFHDFRLTVLSAMFLPWRIVCTQSFTSVMAMASTTFTVRVETDVKKRLEKLAKSTGRSRSFLAAEALSEYLDVNEWQVAGVRKAMGTLDRGESVPHEQVKVWVNSWGGKRERPAPKRSAK